MGTLKNETVPNAPHFGTITTNLAGKIIQQSKHSQVILGHHNHEITPLFPNRKMMRAFLLNVWIKGSSNGEFTFKNRSKTIRFSAERLGRTIIFNLSRQAASPILGNHHPIKQKMILLANTAINLMRCESTDDIFNHLCEQLAKHLQNYVIVVLKIAPSTNRATVFKLEGLREDEQSALSLHHRVLKASSIERKNRQIFTNNTLHQHRHEWDAFNETNFPPALKKQMMRTPEIQTSYSAGIEHQGMHYGVIHLLARKGAASIDKEALEPLLHVAGLALDKQRLHEDLLLANKEAREALKARAEFLSIMSHEIRTPLNSVIGLTDLLLDQNPQREQLRNLRTLKFSAENLLFLINDILDYNKMEAGKLKLEKTMTDIRELTEELVNAFEPATRPKGINISSEIDPRIPRWVMVDKTRLTQILNNLASNALKFTSSGSIRISLSLINNLPQKVIIRCAVKDTGIGIPKEKQESIFTLYSQAHRSTTRNYGGTGLGLSITKRLLELMHSTIELKSEPGKGSEFSFNLTLKKANHPENQIPFVPKKNKAESEPSLGGKRVLMVEDNDINYYLTSQFFKRWDIHIVRAENGKAAIERINNENFDLILMDIQMPVMDGIEATELIRQNPDLNIKDIPIIALTAATLEETRKKARKAGMNDFLTKPINPTELFTKLKQLIPT